jgi:hypothetical protein
LGECNRVLTYPMTDDEWLIIWVEVQVLFQILFELETSGTEGHADGILRVGPYLNIEHDNGLAAAITIFEALPGETAVVIG